MGDVGGLSPRVLVLGELCADIVVELAGPPVFGQTETLVASTTVTMGSSSAITACGLARLGVGTDLVGVAGEDLLGRFVVAELGRRGVGTDAVRVDATRPTGSSTILTRPDGDRAILTALGSIGQVRTADVPSDLLAAARHVHVGSYFLQYALHGQLGEWYAASRAAGRTTSLDPNFDPSGEWDAGLLAVLPHTDVFFGNEDEVRAVAGSAEALLARLPPGGQLVLKRGADGAEVHVAGRGAVARVGVPTDERAFVDAVGAGDSLAAGYLAARLRGLDPAAALAVGVAAGTASTRAAGGIDGQLEWNSAWGVA